MVEELPERRIIETVPILRTDPNFDLLISTLIPHRVEKPSDIPIFTKYVELVDVEEINDMSSSEVEIKEELSSIESQYFDSDE